MSAPTQPAPSGAALHLSSFTPGAPASGRVQSISAQVLAGWHLLSLDAPSVAAVWVLFIARSAAVPLPWTEPVAMFLAVWILYAVDRLLDARESKAGSLGHATPARDLEQRHRFHYNHRNGFYAGLALACPALLCLLDMLRKSSAAALRLDCVLGGFLLGWLLLIHGRPLLWFRPPRLPKEFGVGVFFPAAIFIPVVARVPWLRSVLLPDALLLAAVCSLNCLYIFAWEHRHGLRLAHASTRWAVQRLGQLSATTLVAALTVAAAFFDRSFRMQPGHASLALPALACAVSTVLLRMLHAGRNTVAPVTLRAAADLCLMTPLVLLIVR